MQWTGRAERVDTGRALDGSDIDPQAGAVVDRSGAVVGIDPRLADARVCGGDAGQQRHTSRGVADADGGNQHGQQQAERIAAEVAFASGDPFPGIGALVREVDIGVGLAGPGVENAGGRLSVSALAFADQVPHQTGELLEPAVFLGPERLLSPAGLTV